jgi:hypothetical protein
MSSCLSFKGSGLTTKGSRRHPFSSGLHFQFHKVEWIWTTGTINECRIPFDLDLLKSATRKNSAIIRPGSPRRGDSRFSFMSSEHVDRFNQLARPNDDNGSLCSQHLPNLGVSDREIILANYIRSVKYARMRDTRAPAKFGMLFSSVAAFPHFPSEERPLLACKLPNSVLVIEPLQVALGYKAARWVRPVSAE